MADFQSFDEVQTYLNNLGLFHMDFGLDRVRDALERMNARRLPCAVIQVVGTNGKGSTSTFLHSLAMAHGFHSGLYTSPHFISPAERIRMNTKMLPESAWPSLASRVCEVRPDLTYFELLTVMAAAAFRDTEPDVLIFEAGLGGRHDATSALDADLVCFTPIAMDHMDVLGEDIGSIAQDKADALRPGVRAAVSAPQAPEAALILRRKAMSLKIPLWGMPRTGAVAESRGTPDFELLDPLMAGVRLGLAGPHQRVNARTALTAWLTLCHYKGWQVSPNAVRLGLERAFIPGRLQRVPARTDAPSFLLDGAHNTHGMEALRRCVDEDGTKPCAVIFSCLADKKPEILVRLLRAIAGDAPVFVPGLADNPRAMRAADLAALYGEGAMAVDGLEQALARAGDLQGAPPNASGARSMMDRADRPVLVCGSLYLLGEFFALYPQALEQSFA